MSAVQCVTYVFGCARPYNTHGPRPPQRVRAVARWLKDVTRPHLI